MVTPSPIAAFGMPGYGELAVILVIGLLIFGRRLPEVGRAAGKTMTQFRRGLHDFKQQMNQDEDLRDVKSTMHDLKRAVDAPREFRDPKRMLERLTDEEQSTPGPETTQVAPPDEKSPLEREFEQRQAGEPTPEGRP